MLIIGLFGLVYVAKWPQKVQGLTAKQFKWCCAVIIACGAVLAVWGLLE